MPIAVVRERVTAGRGRASRAPPRARRARTGCRGRAKPDARVGRVQARVEPAHEQPHAGPDRVGQGARPRRPRTSIHSLSSRPARTRRRRSPAPTSTSASGSGSQWAKNRPGKSSLGSGCRRGRPPSMVIASGAPTTRAQVQLTQRRREPFATARGGSWRGPSRPRARRRGTAAPRGRRGRTRRRARPRARGGAWRSAASSATTGRPSIGRCRPGPQPRSARTRAGVDARRRAPRPGPRTGAAAGHAHSDGPVLVARTIVARSTGRIIARMTAAEHRARRCRRVTPAALVVFGATGDLAGRKLYPALASLADRGPAAARPRGRRRRPHRDERRRLRGHGRGRDREGRRRPTRSQRAIKALAIWVSRTATCAAQADDARPSTRSRETLDGRRDARAPRRRRQLPVLPVDDPAARSAPIAAGLGASGLAEEPPGAFRRLVVEKPFGHDLASARELDDAAARQCSTSTQIFRIDHYLAKETVQNILALRFANTIFEPVWNRRYVDHVRDHGGRAARRRAPRHVLRAGRRAARHRAEPRACRCWRSPRWSRRRRSPRTRSATRR